MPDESTQSIVVDAPPERIMAVIADLESYPEWAKAVRKAEVLARDNRGRVHLGRFTLDQGPVQDVYTLRFEWARDGLSVRWSLEQGQMQRVQDGQYLLRPMADGRTEVTYSLAVELALPMIGQLRRKAEKIIMDIALKELKRRVEGDSHDRPTEVVSHDRPNEGGPSGPSEWSVGPNPPKQPPTEVNDALTESDSEGDH